MSDPRDPILHALVRDVELTRQLCDSFDIFWRDNIPKIVSDLHVIQCESTTQQIVITFGKPTLKSPWFVEKDGVSRFIYPAECYTRGITYASPLYVDLAVKRVHNGTVEEVVLNDVFLGKIPIMIYSSLCYLRDPKKRAGNMCEYDAGAYFIINGNEKCIISQRGPMPNRMITYARNNTCAVTVRAEYKRRVFNTTISYKPKSTITCRFPRLKTEVPVLSILIALGLTETDIKNVFTSDELSLMGESLQCLPHDRMEAMGMLPIKEVYNLDATVEERCFDAFEKVMLPHIEMSEKAIFLVHMIKELLAVAQGSILPTDRDSVINQRVETSCELMSTLFHHIMIKMCMDVKKLAQKNLSKRKTAIPFEKVREWFGLVTTLTDSFQYALGTGNWCTSHVDRQSRVGVSQQLQRLNRSATISQLRRVSSSLESSQKLAKPRYINGKFTSHMLLSKILLTLKQKAHTMPCIATMKHRRVNAVVLSYS